MVPFIVANWKMNKTIKESVEFVSELNKHKSKIKTDVAICPPFTALSELKKISKFPLGAQNMFYEEKGAFTGEISPAMLKEFCEYVILGHSERRQYFNETNEIINKKVLAALKHSLKPILCIGERAEQRKAGKHKEIVEEQVKKCLVNVDKKNIVSLTIAYEPVWAIGTGETASPEQAQEMHHFIRGILAGLYDRKTSESVRILYGGSVKADNIKGLIAKKDINGALVGGASLEVDSFIGIVNNC